MKKWFAFFSFKITFSSLLVFKYASVWASPSPCIVQLPFLFFIHTHTNTHTLSPTLCPGIASLFPSLSPCCTHIHALPLQHCILSFCLTSAARLICLSSILLPLCVPTLHHLSVVLTLPLFFHTQVLFCSIIPNFLHYSASFFQFFTVQPPLWCSIAPLLLCQPIYQSDTLTSLISTFYLSHTQSGHGFAHCTAPFVSLMLKGHKKIAKKSVCVWELSSDKYSRHAALF